MKRFISGFMSVAMGNYAAIVLSLGVNVVLARVLGTQQFGRLALLIMASQVLAFFVANWTLTGLVHFGAQEFAARGTVAETFWARIWLLLPWLGVGLVVVSLFNGWLAQYLNVPGWGVWSVFGHFVLVSAFSTASAILQATNRMARYGAALFLDKALTLAILLVLPIVLPLDALRALICIALSALTVSAWMLWSAGRSAFAPIQLTRRQYVALWRFSLPLIATTWLGLFGTQWIDYVMIKNYLSLSELGQYSLSYQIAGVVQQVTIIASTLLLPRYSIMVGTGQSDELRQIMGRIVPYWLLGFSAFLGIFLASVGVVIPIVFGREFTGSVPPLALLIVATVALVIFNTFTPLLTAHGATWAITGICLLSASVNLGMNLALIPRFGIIGAAAATVVAYAVSGGLVLIVVQARLRVQVGRYALFASPVVAVYLWSTLTEGVPFYMGATALLGTTVVGLIRVFRLFEQSDLSLFSDVDLPPWVRMGLLKMFSLRGGLV